MPSPESQRIRTTFIKSDQPVTTPLEVQRREWEAAAAQAPLPPDTTIDPMMVGGVSCERVACGSVDQRKTLLFLHGGGFSGGSCLTHRELGARLSLAAGIPVLLVNYRLAPEHPFPAALQDATNVYRWLVDSGIDPGQIAIGGDSAGGGLAMSTVLALRGNGERLPAAAVLLSPWLDLALAGESMELRVDVDPLTSRAGFEAATRLYIGDHDPRDPLISPVYANLHGSPPLLIHVGDHELLLSDSIRLAERARLAGVDVRLEIWPEMWHVWHAWAAELPEAQAAIDEIGGYVREKLR